MVMLPDSKFVASRGSESRGSEIDEYILLVHAAKVS